MNILHFKYAVEIAKTNSISKAAENLYMGQPNLSRAIKELEEELGISIFNRNTKGISVTPDGIEFLQYAKQIIAQVDEVEQIYKFNKSKKQRFSVCVPRASYIASAMAKFSANIDVNHPAEIFYKETNSMGTINNVLKEDYKLGIIRYQSTFEKYYDNLFEEKKLNAQLVSEFSYVILASKNSPLAKKEEVLIDDLKNYIEIAHADPFVPSLPLIDAKKAELSEHVDKRVFVFERASQFELVENCPNMFMFVSPMPKDYLEKYNLVQLKTKTNTKMYKDVIIYRKEYKLTDLDNCFIDEVLKARKCFMNL